MSKQCPNCGEYLVEDEFAENSYSCSVCLREYVEQNNVLNEVDSSLFQE